MAERLKVCCILAWQPAVGMLCWASDTFRRSRIQKVWRRICLPFLEASIANLALAEQEQPAGVY